MRPTSATLPGLQPALGFEMGKTPPLLPSTQYGSETAVRRACHLPFNLKDAASEVDADLSRLQHPASTDPSFVDAYSNRIGLAQSVRMAAGANNLLQQWRPRSRTFVCYGNKDPMATPNARAVAPTLRRRALRRC